jgi:hypothetical protein
MAAHSRLLEPNLSAQHFFGAELRHRRAEAGLSLAALAGKVFVTADMLGKVEAALRFPSLDLAERSDSVLDAGGVLTRLHAFAMAERERQRQLASANPVGLGPAEALQLRRLLAAISLVAAAQRAEPSHDLLNRIDGVLSVSDTHAPSRNPRAWGTR